VVRIWPNASSCLRLVTALAIETSEEWQERRYLAMEQREDKEGSTQPEAAVSAA